MVGNIFFIPGLSFHHFISFHLILLDNLSSGSKEEHVTVKMCGHNSLSDSCPVTLCDFFAIVSPNVPCSVSHTVLL